ncbi:hypothetical protein R3P38DRAFT_3224005 [Favolaschia claudopus]|uniref:Uncharacterized protein n=1 Tax=Favolaschia claudopus TaxID=2862362 RepID=A0AAV9ZWA4_9AGAR
MVHPSVRRARRLMRSRIDPVKLRFLRFHWEEFLHAHDRRRTREFYSMLTNKYVEHFGSTYLYEAPETQRVDLTTLTPEEQEDHYYFWLRLLSSIKTWYRASDRVWMP